MKHVHIWRTTGKTILLALYSLFVLIPIYEMVSGALQPLQDIEAPKFHFFPLHIQFDAFVNMWKTIPLARYFLNSIFISGVATLCSIFIAVLGAYAFSRFKFKGRTFLGWVILATQMFPGVLFLLPIFVMFRLIQTDTGIQLNGTYLGMIITYMTFALPFAIWMMRGYFESIPPSLDEAALIDGCSRIGVLFRIVIPLALPGIIAVAVFAFITAWNEILFASVLTSDQTRTLSIGLQSYSSRSVVHWNQLMAASIIVTIPITAAFLFVQKYFLFGLAGGVKE